ncbi:MAG: hypothetical protein AAF458_15190 [Pseudomonadota bacterium]
MKLSITWITAVLVVGLAAPLTNSHAARIKCWTNDEGVRECGNKIPPKYAQKGHSEVSKSGLTLKRQEAAISKEEKERRVAEREAKKQAEIEKARLAKIEKRRKRLQSAKDRVLLDTFVEESDLTLAHERKVSAIESRISHRRSHIGKLEESLAIFQKSAANQEKQGKKVSDKTLASIDDVQRQIDASEASIKSSEGEIDRLNDEYETDLGRYRFLKNGGEVGAPLQQS